MWRCKHVADALAKKHFSRMSRWEQVALQTHVRLCFVCGKFHRDVMRMQWCVDELRRREESESEHSGEALSGDSKDRMRAALEDARKAGSGPSDNHAQGA